MLKKFLSSIKFLLKSALAITLVLTLAFSHADGALAARTGGRIGGGSFSAPSRSYSAPRTYSPGGGYGGGYYAGGGGFGFPFLIPFWGIGGGFGGLFSILIVLALANFLVQSLRRTDDAMEEFESINPTVSIAKVQVGLLAEARQLQTELDSLAEKADTGSAAGRAQVLQEAALALLRHPEYWYYGAAESQQAGLTAAEAKFYQLSLTERSKFTEESLSNYNNVLRGSVETKSLPANGKGELDLSQKPGEYIVVTLLAGVQGKLELPAINNPDDLRQALRQIAGVSSERLMALEILWTPQAAGDTLSSDDIIAEYPHLKLV